MIIEEQYLTRSFWAEKIVMWQTLYNPTDLAKKKMPFAFCMTHTQFTDIPRIKVWPDTLNKTYWESPESFFDNLGL